MKVFAKNFRGFSSVEIDLDKITFLVGDNSSGKSSILYLIDAVCRGDLSSPPTLDEEYGVGEYDYFSPYFDFDDVIFAQSLSESISEFSKMITVRRKSDEDVDVVICSYLVKDSLITFRKWGKGVQARLRRGVRIDTFDELFEAHNDKYGFKYRDKVGEIAIANPTMIMTSFDYKEDRLSEIAKAVFSGKSIYSRIMSPMRAFPERFYNFKRKFNAHGIHFATMWIDFFESGDGEFEDGNIFGRESGLFENLKVEKVSKKFVDSPLVVSIEKNGQRFLLNQVGVGVSQVVPILVDCVFSRSSKDTVILVQQPELHLHPVAQAAFGSFLFKESCKGLRGVFETHSSYLIDRFRAEIRDNSHESLEANGKFSIDDTNIIFCENGFSGNTAYPIKITRSGNLTGDPDSYHEFFVGELVRTMF